MKIHVELDETEYEAFREYCNNYKKVGPLSIQCKVLREERNRLMTLIEKEFPNKSLIISCVGLDSPASYGLKDREDDKNNFTLDKEDFK